MFTGCTVGLLMERKNISATPRTKDSKNNALRRQGYLPAVVYGRGSDPVLVSLEALAVRKILNTAAGSNVVLNLQIAGGNASGETVMIKELHRHPVQRDLYLHADLIRISLEEKLELRIPLHFTGESEGSRDGGILQIRQNEIMVSCLPDDIPRSVEVTLTDMKIGAHLTAGEINLPAGVELLEEPNEIIASIATPGAPTSDETSDAEGQERKEE